MPVKHLVAYATGLLALMIAGFVILSVFGRPTTDFVTFMGVILSQAATGIALLLKLRSTDGKVDTVTGKVDEVQKQVNGRMTELIAAKTQPDGEGSTDAAASVPPVG